MSNFIKGASILKGLASPPPKAKPKRASGLAGASAGCGGIGGATAPDGPPLMIVASPSRSRSSLGRYLRGKPVGIYGAPRKVKMRVSMIKSNKWYVIFLVLIFAIFFHPMVSFAKQRVIVEVAGVSCPFCAFGLEKKLKQLPGVEKVTIKINEGKAEIDLAEGKRITKEEVEQAVKESGFTPGKMEFSENKEGKP